MRRSGCSPALRHVARKWSKQPQLMTPVSRHREPPQVDMQGDSDSAQPDSHAAHAARAPSVGAQCDEAGLAQHDPERVLFMMFQYKVRAEKSRG